MTRKKRPKGTILSLDSNTSLRNGNSNGHFNGHSVEINRENIQLKNKISLTAKTENQKEFLKAMRFNIVTIASGCAGVGKTRLSVLYSLREFLNNKYDRIIYTRPCIEANGENLGFLPGDLSGKIQPYMIPIFDFLVEVMAKKDMDAFLKEGSIQTIPLAYQRGMAQPLDVNILTPNGFKKMGDIEKGDEVIGRDGSRIVVNDIFDKGEKEIYRISFSDHTSTECCADHLWNTKTFSEKGYNKEFKTRSTKDISKTLKTPSGQNRHEIPILDNPVNFLEKDTPIDPYLLGALLGDGSLHKVSSIQFITKDLEMLDYISRGLPEHMSVKYASGYSYRLIYKKNHGIGNPLKRKIRELGLLGSMSHNKFIPDIYKFNSVNVRLEILRGLMDTDGSIYSENKEGAENKKNRIAYSTISEQLCDDVMFIINSLGGICYKRKKKNKLDEKIIINGKFAQQRYNSYVLDVSIFNYNIFKLSRKAEMFTYKYNSRRRPKRLITSIEKVGSKRCKCISVSALDGLYLTDNCIVTHNSFRNSFVLLDEAQNTTPQQVRMFLTRMGENCKVVMTGDPDQSDIKTKNGLVDAVERLPGVTGLGIVQFNYDDVVRHPIVAEIEGKYKEEKGI